MDDPRHLEAVHLAPHDAALDDDLEISVDEQLGEVGGWQRRRGHRHRGGCGRHERPALDAPDARGRGEQSCTRSEEHPSELQSLMRISYAAFCLKKKNTN